MMEHIVFTHQMWLVLGMIGLALLLFITEWIRMDVVGLLMMTALPLMGLLDPRRAFSGLASNAVISIGAGMDKAGLIRKLGRHFELTVPEDLPGPLTAQMMRARYQTFLVGLSKFDGGGTFMAPDERTTVYAGDTLAVVAEVDDLNRLIRDFGLILSPRLDVFADELKNEAWGLAEGIVGPRSELVGKTLGEFHFRSKFRINVLAVYRGDEVFETDLDELILKNGGWRGHGNASGSSGIRGSSSSARKCSRNRSPAE